MSVVFQLQLVQRSAETSSNTNEHQKHFLHPHHDLKMFNIDISHSLDTRSDDLHEPQVLRRQTYGCSKVLAGTKSDHVVVVAASHRSQISAKAC